MLAPSREFIEKSLQVEVKEITPYRRNFLLITEQGEWIIKRNNNPKHTSWWIKVDRQLRNRGFFQMPPLKMIGREWMVTPFLHGKTCNYTDWNDVKEAMETLAFFHQTGQRMTVPPYREAAFLLVDRLYQRLKEFYYLLRKASYIPGEFGYLLTKYGPEFYQIGYDAWNRMRYLPLTKLSRKQQQMGFLCHRDLASHNWIRGDDGRLWLIDFETANYDAQLGDVWQLSTRALTINNWKDNLLEKMLRAYEYISPLSIIEKELLRVLYFYPNEFYRESLGLAKQKPGYSLETTLPYLKGIIRYRYQWLQKAGEVFV